MPLPKEDLEGFVEEIERLPQVLDTYKSLKNTNIKNIETPL